MHETSNFQQLKLLIRKNVQLYRRNWGSSAAQFMMPILVCFLLFVLGSNDRYNRDGYNGMTFELLHGPTRAVKEFPVCDRTRMPECTTTLAVVGATPGTPDAIAVLDALVAGAPQLAASDIAYFNTSETLNHHLLASPRSFLIGLHFGVQFTLSAPEYTIQFNRTAACKLGVLNAL